MGSEGEEPHIRRVWERQGESLSKSRGSWVEDGGRQKAWIKTEWGDLQEKMAENPGAKSQSGRGAVTDELVEGEGGGASGRDKGEETRERISLMAQRPKRGWRGRAKSGWLQGETPYFKKSEDILLQKQRKGRH